MRTILHIAICDDRPEQLAKIHAAVTEYFKGHSEWGIQINCFDNSLLFLESLDKTGGCDIALLDICMPGILGTEVAKEIRKRRDKTEIIFLTTSDEYAVDAFALKATHYIMKPFTQQQFGEAMDRAMLRFADGLVKTIMIKPEGGGAQAIDINEILYIESQGHLLTIKDQRRVHMNIPKDHTYEVEKRVTAIPIETADCCGFFKVREVALSPKRECWYCTYASFVRDPTDPHQSGFCKLKK